MFTGQFNSGGEKGLLALSAAQQGVWIAQSLDPASPAFNLAEYIEITGSLDQRLFEAALRHVIAETDALQIRVVEFSESEDLRHSEVEPLLRLHPDPDWKLTVIDCSAESGAEAERLAEKWMKEDLARAVDLTNSAPFYYALLRVGPHRFFWYTRYHHLCIDGLSGALIARRVAEIYVALAEGRNISGGSFPPLSSLLEGETAYRASGQHQADAAYWRKLLADRPETVTLSGKPATSGRGFIRDTRFLSASLAESLHALAAAHGATLPQVMVAAVALYVYRMTGASDFLLGIPLSARIGREMRQIPGMVSNIVPVRIVLSGGEMPGGETESGTFRDGTFTGTLPETCDGTFAGTCGGTFKDLLRQVSSQMREALRHQRYPMAMMRRDLGLNPQEPDVYAAVVNVMSFAYGLQFAGRAARPRNLSNGPVADLSFVVYDRRDDSGLQIDLDANPGNYASDRLTAHLKRFVRMLMSLAEAEADVMDRPLHKIVVVCGEERRALLDDFNATAQTVPQATLPRLFEEQVERTPGAVALMAGRESLANAELTYAELNERSNRLARYLIRLGAGPEKFVGIFLERQAAMLVAMLAVLKSGAAYLPLDPDYPAARLEGMLQDAAPVLVLSSRALSPRLTSASRVIQLDAPEIVAALDTVGANNLAESERISPLLPSHPAYVIYTSGSSGRPKGVVIEHRNTAAFAAWARSRFTAEEWAGVLAGTSICFDLSVFELIVPLTFGGTVILASSPVNLPDPSTARNIRLMNTVPSAARALLDSGNLPANLININLAGESLPGSLVRSLYQTTGVKKVYNLYGPSETTTYSTAALCGNDPLPAQEPSIGGPIWNTQAYVLDRFLEPLPIGATGELYISGLGLARGYLNRPPLTAERFIASPYGAAGSRMYRTGDLARWRSDGEMEFLGRSDQQVKIRGFRIELGEIEAALSAEPDVAQALVVAREDSGRDGGSEGKRLVAYLVLKVGAALNGAGARQGQSLPYEYEEHLRASLRRRLPEYMVPAAFVLLDALPQTPNGKVDRRALPAPQGPRQEYRAPQTPEERFLCEQFAELLSSERVGVRVGIEDHFFHLGGHSLTAMRLVARLRSAFGVEIGLKQIFDAPTVSQLASFVQKAKRAGEKLEQAERADRTGPLPLSYAQQQLWFLYRMEGASFTYNIPLALRLQGELDVAVLKEALADVVGRHEILRTVFPEIDGIPYQKVFSFAEARLAIHEESVDEANLAPRLAAAISTTFELSCEIPLRVWLFRLQPQSHALLFLVHHIAGDAWSLGLLARDFSAAYSARKREAKPDLVPLPFQYADFARWQRKSLGDDHDPNTRLGRQMAFWRRALAGAPEELNLPADRRRPVTPSYRGAIIPVQIEAQLHRAFLQLARSSGASLFMVLQSAFAATLSRLGAGDDIPTGTPVAGRGDRNLDDLIGLFVNTLVMRTDVSEVPSFNQLVARVRTFALEAYENQDLPFERLVDALQPTRSLSRHPLFQVMLVLQNAPERRLELPGVAAKQEPIAENVAKFDLTLVLAERLGVFGAPEGIQGGLEYSLDLFDEQTAAMIAGCFLQFIREAVKHPEVALHSLDLLSEEAQRQIIEDFNAPAALVGIPMERLAAKTVVAMFEEQATRTPEAVALLLAGSEQFLTYRELNGYANRLAYELIERGVAPEKLVGICFDRSLEMVVALLATWKAGGAFLPLDPEYPEARLADIIEDSAPLIVITNQALQSRLPRSLLQSDDSATASAAPSSSFQLISLDSLAYFENRSEINVKSTLTPRHSAYVIYTSGTTGKPKGVVVEHASLATKIRGITAQLNIGPATRFAVMTSLSFDPLLEDLLCPICAGGAAVLVPNEIRQDPQLFANEASRLNLTIVNGSPRLIERLFPEGKFSVRLDALIVGGDVFPPVLADRLLQGGCARRILNFYGPTEATIDAAAYELTGTSAEHRWETIPIGKPLPTYRIYILDCHLQPLPVGVTGDLYIAGACLARGYLNRPALTTERFVADPFSSVGGTRMYRTGDRARWLRDGLLEFAGRVDEQVKIRGFRVELGEIEAALQNQEEIDHAAVVVHEQEPGRKQLVAYITAANGQIPADAALRNRLSKRLPEHMVPSAFVVLDALPLTPNGKLDRAALPAPPGSSRIRRAPRTWEEEILSRSIAELLSLKQVGVEDNFFHLGGDSILSIQLVSRARPAGLQITPRDIFQQQTVEGIASVAVRIAQSLPAPGLSPSEHASFEQAPLEHGVDLLALSSEQRRSLEAKYPGLESILPLSPLQEGLLFHTLYDQSSPDIYTVQLGVEFEGPLEGALMKRAAESMLRRYPNLRVSICHEGLARAAQVVPSKVDLHWVEVDLSGEGSAKRESRYASLLESDRNRPFDLEHGPLLRFSWVEMGMGKNRLIFTNHHVLMDGWSLPIFFKELLELYRLEALYRFEALYRPEQAVGAEEKAVELPPVRPYSDYLQWLSRQDQQASLQLWKEYLSGLEGGTRLAKPEDRKRTSSFRQWESDLPSAITHRLQAVARELGLTLSTVVQGLWALLLTRFAGREEVVFGVTVSGRPAELVGVEYMIGLFINTLPVRVKVRAEEPLRAMLGRMQESHAALLSVQNVGLAEIQKAAGQGDLFDTIVVFENYPLDRSELNEPLPGVRVTRIEAFEQTHYPLSLTVIPGVKPSSGISGINDAPDNGDGSEATLQVRLEFDLARIGEEIADAMGKGLMRMLHGFAENPETPVCCLDILDTQAREQILKEFNAAANSYVHSSPQVTETQVAKTQTLETRTTHKTVVELFEEQVARTPDATALLLAGSSESLTYREVNDRANLLARDLFGHGVGPEKLVGICLDRTPEMVIALLAVLKSGGAFLPLEPEYPVARLADIIEDAAPVVVIGGEALQSQLQQESQSSRSTSTRLGSIKVIRVHFSSSHKIDPEMNPKPHLKDLHPAYVIYTSGTTGRPKGVVVSHASLANKIASLGKYLGITSETRYSVITSLSFDPLLAQVLCPLCFGAACMLVPGHIREDAHAFAEEARRLNLSILDVSPRLAGALLPEGKLPLRLEALVFGGETLPPALANKLLKAEAAARILNLYGPTEVCIDATAHELNESNESIDESAGETVPIGKPLPNYRAYVLDRWLDPLPVGVTGELFLAGVGLARGYLNRPALTAGSFVANPFGHGERMYRTGDLARWRPDGVLEFAGRADQQLKIRGFRIEPAEIEAALQAIAEVGQVAVIAREDGPGGKQLVAYLTPENGVRPDPSTVRQKLKDSLPEHMVPAAFVVLDELPLTPAGKLDIQALPAPNRQTKIHRPPLTDTQTGIAKLFSEVLSIGQAGLDDNFFHLGGDSILTMQLVSRARAMGLLLTPRDVFQQPTVEALAAVAKVVETVEGPSMVNEAADGVGVVVPTPIMHSLFESYGPIDRFTQSVLLHVPVKAQKADLVAALQAVLDTHDVLRLKLDRDERGYRLQVRERGAVSAESCFLKVDSPGADAKTSLETLHRIQRAAEGRLDPQRGVMMQMVWLPGEARLLWVIHHLAVDGVSWRILIPDLASAWQAIQRGARPALEPVQTSFRAWASYLSANAATAAIEAEESVWAAMLASRGSLLPGIVLDSQKDTVSTTGQLKVALPPSTTQALLTSVPSAFHANINDVLLTALALSVARWHNKRNAGTASLSVDLEGHGRESLNGTNSSFDLSRTVGWFTSLFPVSLSLGSVDIEDAFAGGPSLGRALKQVKEQLRAVPGKGLGYGLLRYLHREVGPRLAALPTPQVGFNYLGRFAATRERTDWSIVGDGEGLGGSADGQMPIAHLLEINALTLDGSSGFNGSSGLNGSNGPHRPNGSVEADESHGPSLHASWDWAKRHLTEADAQALADGWCATLEALARYCAQPGVGGNTPSDFPLVALTIEQVEDLERACPDLEDVLPLSSLQEGMLFHGLYERDASHAYTVQLSMEFVGEMDAARMRSAAEVLLHRHPNLRVSLLHQGLKDPVQVVPREANLPWSRVDLTGLDSETQRLRCQELLASDREQRFEFSSGPLLRFTWIALGPHRSRLVFTNHHLLMDGWSMPVLLAELLTLYRDGQDAAQLPRVRPYSDYLKWLSFQDRKEALGIWKEYLTGVEDATRLVAVDAHLQVPSEHSKPKHSKKDVRHDVPEDLTERLQILAREQGVTLNTVLQGLWAVLTARLTGKADVVFGATVAGRPADLPGVERMVGLFINTLPLRVRLRPEEPLRDMLARLQQSQARLLNIQYVGLAEIQAEIQKETGTVELFDTLVVFENYPLDRDALSGLLPGVHINNVETQETAHYPVVLTVAPGRCLHLQLDYDERRLAPESAASLMARLMRLLEAASDPAIPVSKLRILLEDEAQSLNELLHPIESHPSKEPLPQNSSSLVELFEAQVAQAPEATAIIFGEDERKISYAELDVAATRAAHQLCSLGVCRGDLVALRLERGPEFIVAVLAILKAGAAYMPLDIAYPVERVDFMLSDSGAQLLIIKEHASFKEDDSSDPTTFPRYSGRILSMDELLPETVAACSDPVPARHPSDLAYVIYTSGSTGQPKGIAIPQSAVVRLVRNTNYIELGPGDRITHASNTSFDAATFEIWGALLNGGALVILSRETMLSSSRFSTALREFRVDSLFLTTALFQQIVSENPDAFAGVRDLLFGGETIDPSFVRCVLAARRPLRLLHVYGPTENTTFSSWQAVNNVEIGATTVPIGNSISNSRCYVLDQWLDLAPPGVTGELFVSGAGLALGYWNRRARTAESFVADPYGSPGTRMYRTGDLARWNNVGVVEFVGRADQQVKIRGFRIELGEIEAVLREQPGIAQAAVVAQRDDSGTQLVAYLVPADTAALDIEVLRRSLREKLPDYMLPAAFVLLDVLPLTPNGKLDRRSLPAPEWEGDAYVAPETEEEKAICSIFSELLSLERVGVEDDFFVLGGHSLTAMRVVGRVRALLGVDISVRDVFSARTARALSNSILASQLVSNLKNGHSATESHDNLEFEEEEI